MVFSSLNVKDHLPLLEQLAEDAQAESLLQFLKFSSKKCSSTEGPNCFPINQKMEVGSKSQTKYDPLNPFDNQDPNKKIQNFQHILPYIQNKINEESSFYYDQKSTTSKSHLYNIEGDRQNPQNALKMENVKIEFNSLNLEDKLEVISLEEIDLYLTILGNWKIKEEKDVQDEQKLLWCFQASDEKPCKLKFSKKIQIQNLMVRFPTQSDKLIVLLHSGRIKQQLKLQQNHISQ